MTLCPRQLIAMSSNEIVILTVRQVYCVRRCVLYHVRYTNASVADDKWNWCTFVDTYRKANASRHVCG